MERMSEEVLEFDARGSNADELQNIFVVTAHQRAQSGATNDTSRFPLGVPIPVIEPPDILIELEACVAIVPNPKFDLDVVADATSDKFEALTNFAVN